MGRFPLIHRHSVDQFARCSLIAIKACIADPDGKTIAAKPGEPHKLYILRIVAVLEMPYKSLEGSSCNGIIQLRKIMFRLWHLS